MRFTLWLVIVIFKIMWYLLKSIKITRGALDGVYALNMVPYLCVAKCLASCNLSLVVLCFYADKLNRLIIYYDN